MLCLFVFGIGGVGSFWGGCLMGGGCVGGIGLMFLLLLLEFFWVSEDFWIIFWFMDGEVFILLYGDFL